MLLPKANHVFGASQPWLEDKLPEDFSIVLKKTIDFINKS
jgi:hypothetical protein